MISRPRTIVLGDELFERRLDGNGVLTQHQPVAFIVFYPGAEQPIVAVCEVEVGLSDCHFIWNYGFRVRLLF